MDHSIRAEVKVPCEAVLLKHWKKTTSIAEDNPHTGTLLSHSSSTVASLDPSLEAANKKIPCTVVKVDMDKRSQLQLLQKQAPISFLREHSLNGSEATVLKKRNRKAIETASRAWNASQQQFTSSKDKGDEAGKSQLRSSYEVLLRRFCRSMGTAEGKKLRVTLLLLHEDYEQELAVFRDAGEEEEDRHEDEKKTQHLVVCVLGAVRDIRRDEEECAIAAVQALKSDSMVVQTRIIGCNLGRTPEFTSKIVSAMCFHSSQGKLEAALGNMREMSLPIHEHECGSGEEVSAKRVRLEEKRDITGGEAGGGWLRKLKPTQLVSRTTSVSLSKDRGNGVLYTPAGEVPHSVHLHFVIQLPFPFSLVDAAIPSGEATVTGEVARARQRVFPLVQAVVVALWRSRISGEAQLGENPDREGTLLSFQSQSHLPLNSLHIISSDPSEGALELEQLTFIAAMACQHRAAPSEGQVLLTLQSFLKDRVTELSSSGEKVTPDEVVQGILQRKKGKKAVVLHQDDLPAVFLSAYSGACSCTATTTVPIPASSEGPSAEEKRKRRKKTVIVVLGADMHLRARSICMLQHFAYHGRLLPSLKAHRKKGKSKLY